MVTSKTDGLPFCQDLRFSILPRKVKSRLKLYRMRSFLGILFFFVLRMATPAFSVENNSTLVNSDQHSALDYGDALVYGLVDSCRTNQFRIELSNDYDGEILVKTMDGQLLHMVNLMRRMK